MTLVIPCFQLVEKGKAFSDKRGSQSAARRVCAPLAHGPHTCGLRSMFSAVHAAGEHDWIFFAAYGQQTLRDFFNRLKARYDVGHTLLYYPKV